MSQFFIGIDVSKKSHRVVILDVNGEKCSKPFSADPSIQGFNKLSSRLSEVGITPDNSILGMEATGIWWENLYSFLKDNKYNTVVINPHQSNKFREALRKKAKTDDIDAFVIAGLLRSNDFVSCFIPENHIQDLRELVKLRYSLSKDLKNYKRQVFSMLCLIFPEFEKTALSNPFGIAAISILKKFPTAKHLAAAKPKHIEAIVRSIKGNNFNNKEIVHLIDTAKISIYSGKSMHARGLSLNILLKQIEQLIKSISEIDNSIDQILNSDSSNDGPGHNLLTIPGVGPKTLAAILSAIGDGKSFASAKQIIGLVGFYPQIYQSGETLKANRISSRGPRYLRWHLYIAAVACLKHNPELKSLYNKKVSQGKTKKQSLICVAKKLGQLMLSMLKSGEDYKPRRVFVNC